MSKLSEIAARVEASMCMTFGAAHPEGREEARISKADWAAIQQMLTPPASVHHAVEQVLDESSAWISRPSREVTDRIALAATIAAHVAFTPEVTH
jgi:hypothetical protein